MANKEICPECGAPIRGEGVYAGPYWNRRHYCSNSCCRAGERNLSKDDVKEDNLSFFQRLFRTIKRIIIGTILLIVALFVYSYLHSKGLL